MGSNITEGGAHGCAKGGPVPGSGQRLFRAGWTCRAGFSNAQLIGGVALVAVVSLLMQIQSGEINPLTLFAKQAPATAAAKAKPKAKAKKGKPPEMLPPTVYPLRGAAELYVKNRAREVALLADQQEEIWQSFAHMDETAAATLLSALDDKDAVAILAHLEERDLGRILEASPPARASAWVKALLIQPPLDPVPLPFRDSAKRAGLYDDTAELLQQWESQNAGQAAAGAPGAAVPPGTAGQPPPGATTPAQPGTGTAVPGATAPGATAPGTAAPGATTPPATTPTSPAGRKFTKPSTDKPHNGKQAGAKSRPRDKRRPPPPGLIDA